MARKVINLMDDMHLSNQSSFLAYYQAMAANNIDEANSILEDNPDLADEIMNSENINELLSELYNRELEPKEDIDYFLDDELETFQTMINNTNNVGEWNSTTQYYSHNLVYYNDKGYFCYSTTNPPIGTLPTDTNYWLEFDIKGLTGYGGLSNLNYVGIWSSTQSYNMGDMVFYQNKLWYANSANTNYPPNLNHYPWSLIAVPSPATKTAIQSSEPEGYDEGTFWFQIIQGEDIVQQNWDMGETESTPAYASASFMIGDDIYVVGGITSSLGITNSTQVYNTLTNTWSTKADYPLAVHGFIGFSINDIGYCVGGLNGYLLATDEMYSYDPSTNAWTASTSYPFAFSAFSRVPVINDEAYSVGVLPQVGISGVIYKFNPTNATWTEVTEQPITPRIGSFVTAIDSNIYIIGGQDLENVAYSEVLIYNVTTDTWSTGADMITPRALGATFLHGNKIYTVGGQDNDLYSTSLNEVYDVIGNTWKEEIPMTYKRTSPASEYTNTTGYAIGGINIARAEIAGYVEKYQFTVEDASFIMTVDTSLSSSNEISIPMVSSGTYNYYIDWGDGNTSSQITSYDDTNATHTYSTSGEHQIKLIGDLNILQFTGNVATCLTSVDSCTLNLTDITSMFSGCENLTSVTTNIFNNSLDVTSATNTFYNCKKLEIIPQNLFVNNTAITDFTNTFANCEVLTSIPNGLFDSCNGVTLFTATFDGCGSITTIPTGLFAKNSNVTSFENTFQDCASLTSISNNLFINNPVVTSYSNLFSGCTALTDLPSNLFSNACGSATNLSGIFNNTNISTIPSSIFRYASNATNYDNVFNTNGTITTIPEYCFGGNNATWTDAFNISNITTLGNNSLHGLALTTNMFSGQTALTTVGDDVFWSLDSETASIVPSNMFNGCTGLTSVGNINLKGVDTAEDLTLMFSGCTSLTTLSGFYYYNSTTGINEPSLSCNIDFSDCPLTTESLTNLTDSLVTLTEETSKTLTLGDTNLDKLTDLQKLIILNKYWNLDGVVISDVVTSDSAQEIVVELEGWSGLSTTMYQETSLYYYVRLYDPNTTYNIGYYAVEKSTGYVYVYDNLPRYEYYISVTTSASEEGTGYWVSKGDSNDTDGAILRETLNNFKDQYIAILQIGFVSTGIGTVTNTSLDNVEDLSYLLADFSEVSYIIINEGGNSVATDMSYMFNSCLNLSSLNVSSLNTSNVTNMEGMFVNFGFVTTLQLSNFDMSKVTNMNSMFEGNSRMASITFGNFNIKSVTSMTNAFLDVPRLGDSTLNEILRICTLATSYTGTKTLAEIGLNSTQATTCTTLSNYSAFVNAGWTTGY